MKLILSFLFISLFIVIHCADLNPLDVHIIAHTHDDVGWILTPTQYYEREVKNILDTTIPVLLKDSNKRFIYVEMYYFHRWWNEQNATMKEQVRGLVKEGRFEFINAGWTMNDEACVHYQESVTQMTYGHRFLNSEFENLGIPKIGWHIDPFGHSNAQASIMTEIGFDAFMFWRQDMGQKAWMEANKQLEFIWKPSPSRPDEGIFVHILQDSYGRGCSYNTSENWAEEYSKYIRGLEGMFRTKHIFVPFGHDFAFQDAGPEFECMDNQMKYFKDNYDKYKLNLTYSTPSLYTEAVNKEGVTWWINQEDFFGYKDREDAFWAGFYTSHPAVKGYVRKMTALARFAELVYSTTPSWYISPKQMKPQLWQLESANSILTHHDAVTGTSKSVVMKNYAKLLSIGEASVLDLLAGVVGIRLAKFGRTKEPLTFCPLLNESICPATDVLKGMSLQDVLPVVLYNTIGWVREEYVSLPIPVDQVFVKDSRGNPAPCQVLKSSDDKYTLHFEASLPPMGTNTYFIEKVSDKSKPHCEVATEGGSTIENQYFTVMFDPKTNLLDSIFLKSSGELIKMKHSLYYYIPCSDKNVQDDGAYIFKPKPHTELQVFPKPTLDVYEGSVVSEVRQVYSPWASHTLRIRSSIAEIESITEVGPIDISDGVGKEVISKYDSDLQSGKKFWTDAQGQEFQERILNYRENWDFKVTEPISGNYFPINAGIFIKDEPRELQFTLLTDRSTGGSSESPGSVEVMLHRRLLVDDGRGVNEALNDSTRIIVKNKLLFDLPRTAAKHYRTEMQHSLNPIQVMFGQPSNFTEWNEEYIGGYSDLSQPLYPNVYIQTLRPVQFPTDSNEFVLRVHHLYAVGEDANWSADATLDLSTLFTGKKIASIQETKLTAVPTKSQQRMVWKTEGEVVGGEDNGSVLADTTITLTPMSTKTFLVTLADA